MALAYDIELHRELAGRMLQQYSENKMLNTEPMALLNMVPNHSAVVIDGKPYYLPGVNGYMPFYNMAELRTINSGDQSIRDIKMQPAKRGRGRPRKNANLEGAGIVDDVKSVAKSIKKKDMVAAVKKVAANPAVQRVGKAALGRALDVTLPAIGAALGSTLSPAGTAAGVVVGTATRQLIKETTGYGCPAPEKRGRGRPRKITAEVRGEGCCGGAAKSGGARKANPWVVHVKAYRQSHPDKSYKQAMKEAKATYKK